MMCRYHLTQLSASHLSYKGNYNNTEVYFLEKYVDTIDNIMAYLQVKSKFFSLLFCILTDLY